MRGVNVGVWEKEKWKLATIINLSELLSIMVKSRPS